MSGGNRGMWEHVLTRPLGIQAQSPCRIYPRGIKGIPAKCLAPSSLRGALGIRTSRERCHRTLASGSPGHSLGKPLTRRRASSFWGAGRSTEEEGDVNL